MVGEGDVPGSETEGSPNRTSRRDSKRAAKRNELAFSDFSSCTRVRD